MASTITPPLPAAGRAKHSSLLDKKLQDSAVGRWGGFLFGAIVVAGLGYVGVKLSTDLQGIHQSSIFPYLLLGLALLIALGFEFVNGFHDTANAVATVIYTHSLEPHIAVVWSGVWNFLGVLTSSGIVAYTIVALLPVELILKVSKGSGFSMVFALLVAAILWNLGTWWMGLPASSSHTMIGSVIGVGVANQLMHGRSGVSGLDWGEAIKVGKALFFSPIIGFLGAALLLWISKRVLSDPKLFEAPEGDQPPSFWTRCLLILTCTGVSFAHGSNDGQKGMGLIMLILVGTVPTAYALNHTVDHGSEVTFAAVSQQVSDVLQRYEGPGAVVVGGDAGTTLEQFIATKHYTPSVLVASQGMVQAIRTEESDYGSLGKVPANMQANVRNQMYLLSETFRLLPKEGPKMAEADQKVLNNYKTFLDHSTKYIPAWVKVAVALALGLGTMIGWKRIVVTVGERIGKEHLTYAQGASAELVAMGTIMGASFIGVPVSTTHVLSSGVAGTMAANGSGLQWSTIRNIAMAWLLTLPAAALLSGMLYWLFAHIAK
ncbi:inorganic phosphate transporter [Granulicella cerasi]|uniref:Phosphate transporter n=1 Tax=Granulicella cerasi TaxID=741063 RepID=A0ABW1Z8I7_9BACT|nr:inorganic phosphate transporter [Granulicella cerasi]